MKILVGAMGAMILAGFAALIIVIAGRLPHRQALPSAAVPVELPAGGRIETIGVGSDHVVLDIVLPDGTRQLLIIDLLTGRRIGLIPLRPAP